MPDALEVVRPTGVPAEITAILQKAVESGVGVEALEKLVALHERISDRMAASEFAASLAQFQEECPPIPRKSVAKVVSKRTGTSFSYRYAELDEIARVVRPLLHKRGFSYSWDSSLTEKALTVVCTLRHVNGHTGAASFSCPLEDTGGRMSHAQESAAALTYAKRQALIQVLGLTTCEPDADGARDKSTDTITEAQVADLAALIDEVDADEARFLKYLHVDSLAAIPARDFQRAVAALQSKRR